MIVDCTDAVTAVSSTFTQPVLDKPPTFVSGIPGNSPDVSDDNVIATSLGKFTTTDPDTTCSVTLPVTTVYEIRKVASPTDPQKPARTSDVIQQMKGRNDRLRVQHVQFHEQCVHRHVVFLLCHMTADYFCTHSIVQEGSVMRSIIRSAHSGLKVVVRFFYKFPHGRQHGKHSRHISCFSNIKNPRNFVSMKKL
ncbi:hypothetical protein DPMN_022870 [Dreissena polymorpha]|uniref:Uncharacterized protein n=1 Tax=Dreissena polymorpha TaxID=45954 RepID=A0A9D4SC05_DREPO|nr:hypothetical protein DPMN_022870 [Dreissena polymorpha]